jgi:hypothetical protein
MSKIKLQIDTKKREWEGGGGGGGGIEKRDELLKTTRKQTHYFITNCPK